MDGANAGVDPVAGAGPAAFVAGSGGGGCPGAGAMLVVLLDKFWRCSRVGAVAGTSAVAVAGDGAATGAVLERMLALIPLLGLQFLLLTLVVVVVPELTLMLALA